jgi:serine/threonine protein kinase
LATIGARIAIGVASSLHFMAVRSDCLSVCHSRGARIAMDVASGLHFLHSKNIVHMDIKSPNILLNRHYQAKIADVGLAKIRHQTYVSALGSAMGEWADGQTYVSAIGSTEGGLAVGQTDGRNERSK